MPQKSSSELTKQFIQSAINTSATAEIIAASPESVNETLLSLCYNEDAVLLALPANNNDDLFSVFIKNKKVITSPDNEQLKRVNTGITFGFAGVSSTGSVCLSMDNNFTAPVSILTRSHITLINSSSITERPSDLFRLKYKGENSFSFITGPSATADMGPLVRGVHGPGKLHIIVLD